ncbi:MAG: hypothetical protein ABI981_13165 [Betaproteobacteria bacterium]
MNASSPSLLERIPASLAGTPTVPSDDASRGSLYLHRAAQAPLSRSLRLLRAALTLWLLAAFVGASMVASVLAHIFQSGDSMRVETAVLVSTAGIALTWFALRRLRVLIDRAENIDW